MYRLIVPIFALVVSITLFVTFTKPTYEKYQALDVEVKQYDSALARAEELRQSMQNLFDSMESVTDADKKLLMAFLPDSLEEVTVLLSLDENARRNNLTLDGISIKSEPLSSLDDEEKKAEVVVSDEPPDPMLPPEYEESALPMDATFGSVARDSTSSTEAKDVYEITELSFNVTGTYEDFKEFIASLEESLVVIDIVSLAIAPSNEKGISTYSVTINMYTFNQPKL